MACTATQCTCVGGEHHVVAKDGVVNVACESKPAWMCADVACKVFTLWLSLRIALLSGQARRPASGNASYKAVAPGVSDPGVPAGSAASNEWCGW
eukprot:5607272-Amphidinium_carterae.2